MINKYLLTDCWLPRSAPDSLHLASVCITVAPVLVIMLGPVVHPGGAPWLGEPPCIGAGSVNLALVLERKDTLAASCGATHSGAGGGGGWGGGGLLGQAGRVAVPPVPQHVVPKDVYGCGAPWLVKPSICCARGIGDTLVGERKDTRKTNLGPTISQALPSRGGCCGGCRGCSSSDYDDSWGGGG